MAFTPEAKLLGFNRTFEVCPECKPYTLRDNGFNETRGGNFLYKRELDSTHRSGLVLKVTVNADLNGLKISTVNSNGLQAVNVFSLANNEMVIEKINFIFDGFVDRNVLVEVK
ncbi:cysteine desulfurase [Facklamia miroungae]|uniref:Putative amino acid metabolism n=1 Tax=Facklamia miroungae TaxID=120956 RepID=A0A1G7V8B1_9LACT|nr:cysteine desulfurase [Facklamia miroungae]NKZ30251.1 DUF1831 domain-containing protein [Facklamia miroungae]SDG55200.1 Putative amino acid metabolism [Facklamia miroungae]